MSEDFSNRVTPLNKNWRLAAKRVHTMLDSEEAKQAVIDLQAFMDGPDGFAAMHVLLNFTKRHVVFGKSDPIHPGDHPTVYALVGGITGGLKRTATESAGNIAPVEFHTLEKINAEEAVEAAIVYGNKKPEEIMPWLYAELDRIALLVPQ